MALNLNIPGLAKMATEIKGVTAHDDLKKQVKEHHVQVSNATQQKDINDDARGWAASHSNQDGLSLLSSFMNHEKDLKLSENDRKELEAYMTNGFVTKTPDQITTGQNGQDVPGQKVKYQAPPDVEKRFM